MATITQPWTLVKRQGDAIAVPPQCYNIANQLVTAWLSAGGEAPALCLEDGEFAYAFSMLTSCTGKYTNASVVSTVTRLSTPLSYCSSVISSLGQAALSSNIASAAASSSCASYASAGVTPDSNVISCPATSTTSPTDSSTTAPAYTPTLAPSPDSELSKGAIAGIASGSVIGGILILIILALFIRRHRHHAKRRLAAATAADSAARDQTEKAQLHSDEYKPPREELEGSKAPMILRTIEGLHEMEYREMSSARAEMDANEVAAAELRGETFSTPITESSTLVGRSSQGAEQGM